MFRSHFQASAHVVGNEFAAVPAVCRVHGTVAGRVHGEVVAHTAAHKTFTNARNRVGAVVHVEQGTMVGVKIGAYFRMQARRTAAFRADVFVASAHGIHVGRRPSEVADISFEIWHCRHLLYFLHYRFFAA